jgi:hypothetical protein
MIQRNVITVFFIVLAVILTGCANHPRQRRIANNQSEFDQLSAKQQNLILQGQIAQTMEKKSVYMAWGNPSKVSNGMQDGAHFEKWYYFSFTPVYYDNFHNFHGCNAGYYYDSGFYRSPDYRRELRASVEFRDGKVRSWENTQ